MILVIAGVLLALWLLGVVVFHVTVFAVHLLLLVAVIALAIHLVSGRGRSV